jgi:hypothetical protein
MNPYAGSLAFGQVWFVSILCAVVGIIAALKATWRPWGLTLILMGVSLVVGLATVSAFVPSQALPVQPLVTGSFVRIQLRQGTTAQQQEAFLCEYVYSACTPSGNTFRPEITSLTRTNSNELTIGTTPEFQQRLLEQLKRSAVVESAQAGPA